MVVIDESRRVEDKMQAGMTNMAQKELKSTRLTNPSCERQTERNADGKYSEDIIGLGSNSIKCSEGSEKVEEDSKSFLL